ncbi:Osmotin, thaumatin-like protein [Jaminaea rosea]|uniref:Osmotin, thaumatin-like protein n=1 Tax=Jaminaea rosea TaxID=1569628 RepID=A0A316UHG5_9BASI|nr:Osmotin, thaumatin-like protein [Jaminaea rosea]PWN24716.1 Osmotin, thaumatin-like protein [Jaminaea rosea]
MLRLSFSLLLTVLAALSSTCSAFTLNFVNRCPQPLLVGVARAPNGQPDPNYHEARELGANGGTGSVGVDDHLTGVRAWPRTGCKADGTGCQTGGCVGGRLCTDGGLQAAVQYAEFGYGDFGTQYGGERIAWDLSHVDSSINVGQSITDNKGQTVVCKSVSCDPSQSYNQPYDSEADRNSPLGTTFTITYCP